MEITMNRNGTYNAEDVLKIGNEKVGESGSDWYTIKTLEPAKAWNSEMMEYFDIETGTCFVIYDGLAYPFEEPFYEKDEDEGIDEQKYPENWEDVLGHIEGFGR